MPTTHRLLAMTLTTGLGLAWATPAEASFGGKIKNIRIRERNNSQGYRVVTVVKDDEGDLVGAYGLEGFAPGGVALDLGSTEGSAAAELSVTSPRRASATFVLDGVELSAPDGTEAAYELSLCTTEDVAKALASGTSGKGGTDVGRCVGTSSIDSITVPADDEVHEFTAVLPDGGEVALAVQRTIGPGIKIEINSAGLLIDGGSLEIEDIAGIDLTASSGSKLSLDGSSVTVVNPVVSSTQARFVGTVDSDNLAGLDSVVVAASLSDADGIEVDSLTRTLSVDGETAELGIWSSRLSETRKGKLRHKVKTVSTVLGTVSSVDAVVSDAATGAELLTSTDDTPLRRSRLFTSLFTFEDDPTGSTLSMTLSANPSDGGGALDANTSLEVSLLPGEVTPVSTDCCTEVVVFLGATEDPTIWELQVAVGGEDVELYEAFEAQFNEPFEGPAPIENNLSVDFVLETAEWVATTSVDDGLGTEGYEVDVQLLDAEGSVREVLSWDGNIDEKATGNGKGTRTVATQSNANPKLL